ncbi:MAG: zinc-ribbon domain-containing protein [Nanoarchaeota archaeon]|nr:zinc-ribbon domain-containing protein [Nanoarchaeota archaeon]
MILFGWKTKPQVKGATKGKCFACKKLVQHAIVQVTHWFTLYFIPIIPYKKQLFVVCHNCGAKTELKDDAKK